MSDVWIRTVGEMQAQLPGVGGEHFVTALRHGSLEVELYAPRGQDLQEPHTRDELYVVISGAGLFIRGDETQSFGPGDVIFVPAYMPHRFEGFSDDFATWVIFYGPQGGETT